MGFTLEAFVADARAAAAAADPLAAVTRLMADTLADPARVAAGAPTPDRDETCLFEDATVSVWHERFQPDVELPPHDHAMPAVLGVYQGRERNRLWHRVDGLARPGGALVLEAGGFHVFGPDDIHSVHAEDGAPSLGLHVYLGPLTTVPRSLFDWETGAAIPLTGANFETLLRPLS
ncbi:hypothetical protein [Jannaschia sp. M317]|uniref:hypothetical protein n=1 Tax=Jannaschia sp. M317 TaxID=2867011 RepID=UPI0021A5870A|nr:hypothetical protein [Jannaschia sp. M317]UWQ18400.1 hypothetical protein K3551_03595 [Jannaschia sp. M317]